MCGMASQSFASFVIRDHGILSFWLRRRMGTGGGKSMNVIGRYVEHAEIAGFIQARQGATKF